MRQNINDIKKAFPGLRKVMKKDFGFIGIKDKKKPIPRRNMQARDSSSSEQTSDEPEPDPRLQTDCYLYKEKMMSMLNSKYKGDFF